MRNNFLEAENPKKRQTMKSRLILALGCAVSLASIGLSHASIIAQWTFETSVPTTAGPYAPELGSGSASGFHSGVTTYSNPVGNGSTESFSANKWSVGDYWQFAVSTVGYTGITLSWDQMSSSTGPTSFQLAYSIDGSIFTEDGSQYMVSTSGWTSPNMDLSAINGLDNQATTYIRLINKSSAASAGTDRIDNFTISGTAASTAVPEPSTYLAGALLLLPLGLSAFSLRRYCRHTA